MMSRARNQILIASAAVLLSLGGITTLTVFRSLPPGPMLDEVRALARAGQFPRAQALLERYLQVSPKNDRAHLLMAQLTTEPTNPQPGIALAHLRIIQTDTPQQTAKIKFLEGKARYQQGRYDLAEDCWTEALRLDPIVPEAGWALVDLLDKEGRQAEAHRVGMRLHEVEPDPRDRVRILLEMSRLDIESPEAHSQIELFGPLAKQRPESLPLAVTLGQALVRFNGCEEGLEVLRNALRHHPDSPEAWDAWLSALALTPDINTLAEEFSHLPPAVASDPRFAKHEGMVAQLARDWPRAVRAYRRAYAFEPHNMGVIYRYRFVLGQAKETAEFERMNDCYINFKDAFLQMRGSLFESTDRDEDPRIEEKDFKQTRGAYCEVRAIKKLGVKPYPKLYQRLADLRETMGRPDEARAWHRLVLRDFPDNALSLAALARLK
jgi:tetratricopeptide (TPR) repeat protein